MKRTKIATAESPSAPLIKDLLSYRLHRLAGLFSRSAAMRYRRMFDVSLGEWRSIALLGAYAPLSVNDMALAADIDKGQVSRVVSGLVERGLVRKDTDEADGRGVRLSLTRLGRQLYDGLMRAARRRNERLLAALTDDERRALDTIFTKLEDEARRLIREEAEPNAVPLPRPAETRAALDERA